MSKPPPSRNELAAGFIARHVPAAEQVLFAEMLGIVGWDGFAAPDDLRPIKLEQVLGGGHRGGLSPEDKRSIQSTAPDALRNLPPIVPPPAPSAGKATKPRPAARNAPASPSAAEKKTTQRRTAGVPARQFSLKCGTRSGYNAHRNQGEKPCRECMDSENARARAKYAARLGRPLHQSKVQCGTPSGATTHSRRGEEVCGPCREAKKAYERDRYRARRAAA